MPRLFDAESERWLEIVPLPRPFQVRLGEPGAGGLLTCERGEVRVVYAGASGPDVSAVELDLYLSKDGLIALAERGGIVPFQPAFARAMPSASRGLLRFRGTDELIAALQRRHDDDVATALTAHGPHEFAAGFDLELYHFADYVELPGSG